MGPVARLPLRVAEWRSESGAAREVEAGQSVVVRASPDAYVSRSFFQVW